MLLAILEASWRQHCVLLAMIDGLNQVLVITRTLNDHAKADNIVLEQSVTEHKSSQFYLNTLNAEPCCQSCPGHPLWHPAPVSEH